MTSQWKPLVTTYLLRDGFPMEGSRPLLACVKKCSGLARKRCASTVKSPAVPSLTSWHSTRSPAQACHAAGISTPVLAPPSRSEGHSLTSRAIVITWSTNCRAPHLGGVMRHACATRSMVVTVHDSGTVCQWCAWNRSLVPVPQFAFRFEVLEKVRCCRPPRGAHP
jgi:hypothetical protein